MRSGDRHESDSCGIVPAHRSRDQSRPHAAASSRPSQSEAEPPRITSVCSDAAGNRNRVDRGMTFREPRVAIGATWGVVGAFAVVQAVAWAPHGVLGGIPWTRAAVVQAVAAWAAILILAVASTRRILRSTAGDCGARTGAHPDAGAGGAAGALQRRAAGRCPFGRRSARIPDARRAHRPARRRAIASVSRCCPTTARSFRPTRRGSTSRSGDRGPGPT